MRCNYSPFNVTNKCTKCIYKGTIAQFCKKKSIRNWKGRRWRLHVVIIYSSSQNVLFQSLETRETLSGFNTTTYRLHAIHGLLYTKLTMRIYKYIATKLYISIILLPHHLKSASSPTLWSTTLLTLLIIRYSFINT